MCIEEDVGVKDLEANMKRLLIRLTGLMVTAAIVLSTSGIAMATEVEGQDNGTDVAATEPAEIPDTVEPAPVKEEEPAPAGEPAAEEPAAPAKADDPAAKEPAEEPAKEEEPAAKGPAAPAEGDIPEEGNDKTVFDVTVERKGSVKLDKDNDALAEDYINRVFDKVKLTKRSSYNYASGLSGNNLAVYTYLNGQIAKVAAGEISSTEFSIPGIDFTAEDLGLSDLSDPSAAFSAAIDTIDSYIPEIIDTLVMANPYNFYWFGNSYSWVYGASLGGNKLTLLIDISFKVSVNYQGANEYIVDSKYGALVNTAHEKALGIVNKYASLDDYNKLKAYRDEICDLTEYNTPASQGGVAYGNPWQMIWVFDGDPNTTVVCEGYSKAFQFLCDNSTFQNSNVYVNSVTGQMDGGNHMWNVVHMDDGNNYLVDVTNCDSLGRDVLFLRGKASNLTGKLGYNIAVSLQSISNIVYEYDTDSLTPDIATSDYVYNPGYSGYRACFCNKSRHGPFRRDRRQVYR